jgi:hypothetical protein
LIIIAIGTNKRRAHHDIGRPPTTTSFRNRHCSYPQHPLYPRQCSAGTFIGFGFTAPEPMLSTTSGHHFIGDQQQPRNSAAWSLRARAVQPSIQLPTNTIDNAC